GRIGARGPGVRRGGDDREREEERLPGERSRSGQGGHDVDSARSGLDPYSFSRSRSCRSTASRARPLARGRRTERPTVDLYPVDRVFPRGRFGVAAAAGCAWLTFYGLWLTLRPGGAHGIQVFADTAYLAPIAAATGLAALA